MATLTLSKLDKNYGAFHAVKGIDLDVSDGEFVALVGPSGCGKSTTLRMIAGLEDITGGDIRIGERVVNDLAPRQRNISMVFQSYALYPHMTVAENMGFTLKIAGKDKAEIDAAVAEAARALEITPLLERLGRWLVVPLLKLWRLMRHLWRFPMRRAFLVPAVIGRQSSAIGLSPC